MRCVVVWMFIRVKLERAMGIALYSKFLSLAKTRCYQPLCESIVAKCCQDMVPNFPIMRAGQVPWGISRGVPLVRVAFIKT